FDDQSNRAGATDRRPAALYHLWTTEKVALKIVKAQFLAALELINRFDLFGDEFQRMVAHGLDCPIQRGVIEIQDIKLHKVRNFKKGGSRLVVNEVIQPDTII